MTGAAGAWIWAGLSCATLALWVVVAVLAGPDLYHMPRLDKWEGQGAKTRRSDSQAQLSESSRDWSTVPRMTFDTMTMDIARGVPPKVSVVIAARDEARALEQTLASLADQTLSSLEIIVVDDRSQDGTPAVIQHWTQVDPRIRGLRIDTLPPGWLGKNHAMHQGARMARGKWIVFMDADVTAAPTLLMRAVAWCEQHGVDVLTLAPRLQVSSWWLAALIRAFVLNFVLFIRPQSAHRPRSAAYAGIGAFLMVPRVLYWQCGGHAPVRMRVDDDAALAKWLKRCGAREQMVFAGDLCSLTWYASVPDMMRGMEKNPLAAFAYRPWALMLCIPLLLWIYLGPWLCMCIGPRLVRWTGSAALLLITAMSALLQPVLRGAKPADIIQWPFGAVLLAYAYLRAAVLAWRRGALEWRDTRYPLDVLRANRHIGLPGPRR